MGVSRTVTEPDSHSPDSVAAKGNLWLHGLLADLGVVANTQQIEIDSQSCLEPAGICDIQQCRSVAGFARQHAAGRQIGLGYIIQRLR